MATASEAAVARPPDAYGDTPSSAPRRSCSRIMRVWALRSSATVPPPGTRRTSKAATTSTARRTRGQDGERDLAVDLSFPYSARSRADRTEKRCLLEAVFAGVPMSDGAWERANEGPVSELPDHPISRAHDAPTAVRVNSVVRAMGLVYISCESPSDRLNPHILPFPGTPDRHPRSASGRSGALPLAFSRRSSFPWSGAGERQWHPCRW
jgi:hypothetical protein